MSDLPRVLLCSFDVLPAPTGFSRRMTEYLKGLGGQYSTVVLSCKTQDVSHIERYHGSRLLRVPVGTGDLASRLQTFERAVRRQLESEEYAIAHFFDPFGGYVLSELKAQYGYRAVYEADGFPSQELRYTTPSLAGDRRLLAKIRRQELFCLMNADLVLTGSQVTHQFIQGLGVSTQQIRVLRAPVDLGPYTSRASRAPDGTPMRVLYLGSQLGWQGVPTLLRAVQRAAAQVDLKLTLTGPTHPDYQARIDDLLRELQLGSRVEVLPPVGHDELCKQVIAADVGVVPLEDNERNRAQGGPLAKISEYFAGGRPVIAADLPVCRELLPEGAALFFKPGDVEDLAARLVELARNPRRRVEMGSRARAEAVRHLDSALIRERILALYEALVGNRPAPDPRDLDEPPHPTSVTGTPTRRVMRTDPDLALMGDVQHTDPAIPLPEQLRVADAAPAGPPRAEPDTDPRTPRVEPPLRPDTTPDLAAARAPAEAPWRQVTDPNGDYPAPEALPEDGSSSSRWRAKTDPDGYQSTQQPARALGDPALRQDTDPDGVASPQRRVASGTDLRARVEAEYDASADTQRRQITSLDLPWVADAEPGWNADTDPGARSDPAPDAEGRTALYGKPAEPSAPGQVAAKSGSDVAASERVTPARGTPVPEYDAEIKRPADVLRERLRPNLPDSERLPAPPWARAMANMKTPAPQLEPPTLTPAAGIPARTETVPSVPAPVPERAPQAAAAPAATPASGPASAPLPPESRPSVPVPAATPSVPVPPLPAATAPMGIPLPPAPPTAVPRPASVPPLAASTPSAAPLPAPPPAAPAPAAASPLPGPLPTGTPVGAPLPAPALPTSALPASPTAPSSPAGAPPLVPPPPAASAPAVAPPPAPPPPAADAPAGAPPLASPPPAASAAAPPLASPAPAASTPAAAPPLTSPSPATSAPAGAPPLTSPSPTTSAPAGAPPLASPPPTASASPGAPAPSAPAPAGPAPAPAPSLSGPASSAPLGAPPPVPAPAAASAPAGAPSLVAPPLGAAAIKGAAFAEPRPVVAPPLPESRPLPAPPAPEPRPALSPPPVPEPRTAASFASAPSPEPRASAPVGPIGLGIPLPPEPRVSPGSIPLPALPQSPLAPPASAAPATSAAPIPERRPPDASTPAAPKPAPTAAGPALPASSAKPSTPEEPEEIADDLVQPVDDDVAEAAPDDIPEASPEEIDIAEATAAELAEPEEAKDEDAKDEDAPAELDPEELDPEELVDEEPSGPELPPSRLDPWFAQLAYGYCPPQGIQFARHTPPTTFPGRDEPPRPRAGEPPSTPAVPSKNRREA